MGARGFQMAAPPWGPLHRWVRRLKAGTPHCSPGVPEGPGTGGAGDPGTPVPTPLSSPALGTGTGCHFGSCFQSCPRRGLTAAGREGFLGHLLGLLQTRLFWTTGHAPRRCPLAAPSPKPPGRPPDALYRRSGGVRSILAWNPVLGGRCGTGSRLAQHVPALQEEGEPAPGSLRSVLWGPRPSAASLPLQPP